MLFWLAITPIGLWTGLVITAIGYKLAKGKTLPLLRDKDEK